MGDGVRCGDYCGDGNNGGCPEGAFCTDNDDGTVTCSGCAIENGGCPEGASCDEDELGTVTCGQVADCTVNNGNCADNQVQYFQNFEIKVSLSNKKDYQIIKRLKFPCKKI